MVDPMAFLKKLIIALWPISIVFGVRYIFGEPQSFGDNQHFEYIRYFLPITTLISLGVFITYFKEAKAFIASTKRIGLFWILLLFALISTALSADTALSLWWITISGITIITAFFYIFLIKLRYINYKFVLGVIVFLGVAQAGVGIAQFSLGHSIGLSLLGEPTANNQTLGVAKLVIAGEKFLRPFGTFGHANIFGGFLVASFMALLSRYIGNNGSRLIPNLAAGIILFGILLSYSRSAWISVMILVVLSLIYLEGLAFLRAPLAAIIVAIIIGFPGISGRFLIAEQASQIVIRENLNSVALANIAENPLFGSGPHTFVNELEGMDLESYERQPVHNSFLLLASEFGLLFLAALVISIFYWLRRLSGFKKRVALIYIASLLPLLLFDHYLFSIWTGTGIIALVALIIASVPRGTEGSTCLE